MKLVARIYVGFDESLDLYTFEDFVDRELFNGEYDCSLEDFIVDKVDDENIIIAFDNGDYKTVKKYFKDNPKIVEKFVNYYQKNYADEVNFIIFDNVMIDDDQYYIKANDIHKILEKL